MDAHGHAQVAGVRPITIAVVALGGEGGGVLADWIVDLAQPDMQERLATLGYDVVASTPEEFAIRIKTEIDMWAKVICAANIKAE